MSSRPARPIRSRSAGSDSWRTSADTRASPSRPSTTSPVTPSSTVSGAPPLVPAMTGSPVAEASRKTMPSPSTSSPPPRVRQGMAKTSPMATWPGSSSWGTAPVRMMEPRTGELRLSRASRLA